jgi:hypothetical protein
MKQCHFTLYPKEQEQKKKKKNLRQSPLYYLIISFRLSLYLSLSLSLSVAFSNGLELRIHGGVERLVLGVPMVAEVGEVEPGEVTAELVGCRRPRKPLWRC